MSKPFGNQYHFSGDGTTCGTMECTVCRKKIHSSSDVFMSYNKMVGGDLEYRTRHRKCTDSQKGWEIIEQEKEKFYVEVQKLSEILLQYKDNNGFNSILYSALESIGFDM